ncbi:hypothetical protein LL912_20405 [Niabella sp. CC-SYL272]|uniref:hypothetical protein n=1 Tax=Niabella agricola TaxID=2891571 RepID=UPI001F1A5E03|nr:hypothetical protein [Niabella agricola]MCF3111162.1 hypothetical protein [Niabella agricola]
MKYQFLLMITMLIICLSCKKAVFEDDYQQSYRTWLSFRDNSRNQYQYTKVFSSWSGSKTEYTITVKNGAVIRQEYKGFIMNYDIHQQELKETWIETTDNINTHHPYETALTLDKVYIKAKNEWLKVNPDENHIYFETQNRGMISSCGFVPKGCQDDCFQGIRITDIRSISGS